MLVVARCFASLGDKMGADRHHALMAGPYENERQVLADCEEAYEVMRTRQWTMADVNRVQLLQACVGAGIELGEYDRSVLAWLASFEPHQAQVIADIVRRAAKAASAGAVDQGDRCGRQSG